MVLPTSSSSISVNPDHEPGHEHVAGPGKRKLILCFDGTSNSFGGHNTNVVKLASYLKKDDYTCQMVYYQTGVGTHISIDLWDIVNGNDIWAGVKKVSSLAVGWDIRTHILGGYNFLMQNWKPDDRVYIFGFSRGAYTARALAGMLHKVGLLPRGNEEQVQFAYKMYMRTDKHAAAESSGFKEAFCSNVMIDFLGVWDTVESVGLLHNWHFPLTSSGHHIRVFRHALGLDERRVKFMPQHYQYEASLKSQRLRKAASSDSEASSKETDVLEVWFAGGHGEVGGGNYPNDEPYDPARIPLIWMLRELVLTDTGIQFDHVLLKKDGIELPARPGDGRLKGKEPAKEILRPTHCISNLNERYKHDIKVKLVDQLEKTPAWWILEFLPISHSSWDYLDVLAHSHFPHLGRPRTLPQKRVHVHISVKDRMLCTSYKPKATWQGEPIWVE